MRDKMATGARGEELAARFLEKKGYSILLRNYRFKHAEIDLIARIGNFLVFVEVKTRKSNQYGEPESFVNNKKAEKVLEAAENYIFETDWNGDIRFDVVAVRVGAKEEIVHFEDAFY